MAKRNLLSAIYDIDTDAVEEFYSQWKIKPATVKSSLADIKKESFDLAVIASSSEAHFENAKFAISLGIKSSHRKACLYQRKTVEVACRSTKKTTLEFGSIMKDVIIFSISM